MKISNSRHLLRLLLVTGLVGFAAPAAAQSAKDSTERELALRLLRATKVSEVLLAGIEANLPAQKAAMPQVPDEFWRRFVAKAKQGADSLSLLIAPVYTDAFTEQELRGLLEFYSTPLGQRLIKLQPQIMTRSAKIGQQWGAAIGMSVAQELEAKGRP
jgi:hypothetical protein